MRSFQNSGNSERPQSSGRPQNSGRPPSSGRPQSTGRPPSGGRPGYGRNEGGFNRDNRSGGGDREGNRVDRNENRGSGNNYRPMSQHSTSSSYRGGRNERYDQKDRSGSGNERFERKDGNYSPRPASSWVEVPGRTVEEAIEEAARRFNVNRNDLKTQTLEEGSKGFLGIGSKPARVKVSLKPNAIVPFAEGVLIRLLRGMGLPDTVKTQKDSDGNSVLNIEGPSSGTLIGRHGNTLESLQYLVLKVVLRMTGDEKTNLTVDVENYLERQKDKLKELAVNLALQAKETGVEIPMRPMTSKDRREVHLTLKEHEHVTTESRGEGLRRKVVIVPKVKAVVQPAVVASVAADLSPEALANGEEDSTASTAQVPALDFDERQPFTPVEIKAVPAGDVEPGNLVPAEKPIDDDIGNH